jgi:putative transposase
VIHEMKCKYPNKGLSCICRLFGVTRQAFYQHTWEKEDKQTSHLLILKEVSRIRQLHHQIGGRKLYLLLASFLVEHGIKIGRDALFDLLAANNLLVRKRKRRIQTTYSSHWLRKYPNLIKDIIASRINHIWVSDITYWKINASEHLYISLVTDAYSRKIVGYNVAQTMEAVESVQALRMALSALGGAARPLQLIHHSDRGIQYCSSKYVNLLQDYRITISMSENGDPLENAIAERVNGILKEEYLSHYQIQNIDEAKKQLNTAIKLYNEQRPHMSINNHTPDKIYKECKTNVTRLWKNYYKKLSTFNQNCPVNLMQDLSINL